MATGSKSSSNSMAAFLGGVMTVIFWATLIIGTLIFALLVLGLVAALNSGEIVLPGLGEYSEEKTAFQLGAVLIAMAIVLPAILYICKMFRLILGTLADGDPFVPENGPRLTKIAIAIGIMEIARSLSGIVLSLFYSATEEEHNIVISISFSAWVAVISLLILAQVFGEGTRLREEEKMTI